MLYPNMSRLVIDGRTDIELLTAVQMLAVKEAKYGRRLTSVQFSDWTNLEFAHEFSDHSNFGDDWGDEPYDERLFSVSIIPANGKEHAYLYRGNGTWIPWVTFTEETEY